MEHERFIGTNEQNVDLRILVEISMIFNEH